VCVGVGGCRNAYVCLRSCRFTYTARNAPPYCHLWPLWLHQIFRYYLTKSTIFEKMLLDIKFLSTNFISKNSHSNKNSARSFHKCENVFMSSTCFSFPVLMTFESFSKYFLKKLIKIRPVEAELFHADGWKDTKLIIRISERHSLELHTKLMLYS
jgi:hypothetical protein